MSDEHPINADETPIPEAPKGASFSIKSDAIKNPGPNQNGEAYLGDKAELTPEGMISAFREMRETDDPVNAILVTEIQEVKAYVKRVAQIGLVSSYMLAVVCIFVIYTVRKDGISK